MRCGFEAERIWRVTSLDEGRFQRAGAGWVSYRAETEGKTVWIVEPEKKAA
jgi:hypothetical protein